MCQKSVTVDGKESYIEFLSRFRLQYRRFPLVGLFYNRHKVLGGLSVGVLRAILNISIVDFEAFWAQGNTSLHTMDHMSNCFLRGSAFFTVKTEN